MATLKVLAEQCLVGRGSRAGGDLMSDIGEQINFFRTTWLLVSNPSGAALLINQTGQLVKALKYYSISLTISIVADLIIFMIMTNNRAKRPDEFIIVTSYILFDCTIFILFYIMMFIVSRVSFTNAAKLYLYFIGICHLSVEISTGLYAWLGESSLNPIRAAHILILLFIFLRLVRALYKQPLLYFFIIFLIWRTASEYGDNYYHYLIDPLWDRLSS